MTKPQHETLPAAIAHHPKSFSGRGVYVLAIGPDGSGFLCRPAGDEMDAEQLDRDQMIEKVIGVYGLAAFRAN